MHPRSPCRISANVVLALLMVSVLTAGVRAHAELRAERPAAGALIGGSITTIDVSFIFMKQDGEHVLTLRGPDGEIVAPTMALTRLSETHLQLGVPELTTAGRYDVSYLIEGADDDFTPGAYFFNWDPQAPDAPAFVDFNPFKDVAVDDGGASMSGATQAVVVGSAVLVTLGMLVVLSRIVSRRAEPEPSE